MNLCVPTGENDIYCMQGENSDFCQGDSAWLCLNCAQWSSETKHWIRDQTEAHITVKPLKQDKTLHLCCDMGRELDECSGGEEMTGTKHHILCAETWPQYDRYKNFQFENDSLQDWDH